MFAQCIICQVAELSHHFDSVVNVASWGLDGMHVVDLPIKMTHWLSGLPDIDHHEQGLVLH